MSRVITMQPPTRNGVLSGVLFQLQNPFLGICFLGSLLPNLLDLISSKSRAWDKGLQTGSSFSEMIPRNRSQRLGWLKWTKQESQPKDSDPKGHCFGHVGLIFPLEILWGSVECTSWLSNQRKEEGIIYSPASVLHWQGFPNCWLALLHSQVGILSGWHKSKCARSHRHPTRWTLWETPWGRKQHTWRKQLKLWTVRSHLHASGSYSNGWSRNVGQEAQKLPNILP